MKKLRFIETLKSFTYPAKEYKYKYLLVNKDREYQIGQDDGIYRAKAFNTKLEAWDFLRNEVPKVDKESWKLYVLEEPRGKNGK